MFDSIDFGLKIKQLRLNAHLSQRDVAVFLGVSPTQISDIEKGKSSPSLKRAYLLACFFNVSLDYLVGISEANPNSEIIDKLNSLSDDQKEKVSEYIDFLKSR